MRCRAATVALKPPGPSRATNALFDAKVLTMRICPRKASGCGEGDYYFFLLCGKGVFVCVYVGGVSAAPSSNLGHVGQRLWNDNVVVDFLLDQARDDKSQATEEHASPHALREAKDMG